MQADAECRNSTVVRTSRGLTVGGTRLTIYALMDHFKAGWPQHLVQQAFNLSDRQIDDILAELDRVPRDPEKARLRRELDAKRKWTQRS